MSRIEQRPPKERAHITLDPDVLERCVERANQTERSLSWTINQILRKALKLKNAS